MIGGPAVLVVLVPILAVLLIAAVVTAEGSDWRDRRPTRAIPRAVPEDLRAEATRMAANRREVERIELAAMDAWEQQFDPTAAVSAVAAAVERNRIRAAASGNIHHQLVIQRTRNFERQRAAQNPFAMSSPTLTNKTLAFKDYMSSEKHQA